MPDTFWLNNPGILVDKKHLLEVWPTANLGFSCKLNAITRLVILLTIVGFVFTRSVKILISAAVTLAVLVIVYKTQNKRKAKTAAAKKAIQEGFTNPALYKATKHAFTPPTQKNPFMNVLLPQIKYDPKRKPAAPSFNPAVEEEINDKTGNVGPNPRFFMDLGDSISFQQSQRNFYSTANTKVPNDQTAFAQYLYGNMPSCKDGDGLQCLKDNPRWINY